MLDQIHCFIVIRVIFPSPDFGSPTSFVLSAQGVWTWTAHNRLELLERERVRSQIASFAKKVFRAAARSVFRPMSATDTEGASEAAVRPRATLVLDEFRESQSLSSFVRYKH